MTNPTRPDSGDYSNIQRRRVLHPPKHPPRVFHNPAQAVDMLCDLHDVAVRFLRKRFLGSRPDDGSRVRYRAWYPEIRVEVFSHSRIDTRLSFGRVSAPGVYTTTITRPAMFRRYLIEQIGLLIENYGAAIEVANSNVPMPVQFAMDGVEIGMTDSTEVWGDTIPDHFDMPDLSIINDDIVNGVAVSPELETKPLAPFTAPRVDYSLARLRHYTATHYKHFQPLVLFTNYQFYVNAFEAYARRELADSSSEYNCLVTPGDQEITDPASEIIPPASTPQMPAYHLKRQDGDGISLINIGIGPSNAKTATDHIAVLRSSAWIMLGHCAGLRVSQNLGDYVLAHAYLRKDQVLDLDLPVWMPVPALAEIQKALEHAVGRITSSKGYDLKTIMRTGTVASVDNRNWVLQASEGLTRQLSQSRAIALDMESATIAANGFRFRVPYGTLLCVSDKPLHGELKLPGMASRFYRSQVDRHLMIGIKALESLREMPQEFLHSRKLRSFSETAFR